MFWSSSIICRSIHPDAAFSEQIVFCVVQSELVDAVTSIVLGAKKSSGMIILFVYSVGQCRTAPFQMKLYWVLPLWKVSIPMVPTIIVLSVKGSLVLWIRYFCWGDFLQAFPFRLQQVKEFHTLSVKPLWCSWREPKTGETIQRQ